MDTFFLNVTSTHGNKCGQFFATDFGYNKFVPMASKSEAGYALQEVIREIGIPNQIHTDGAKKLTQGRWRDICRYANILTTQTESKKIYGSYQHAKCFVGLLLSVYRQTQKLFSKATSSATWQDSS